MICEYCGRNDLPCIVMTATLRDKKHPEKERKIQAVVCMDCLEEKDGRVLH